MSGFKIYLRTESEQYKLGKAVPWNELNLLRGKLDLNIRINAAPIQLNGRHIIDLDRFVLRKRKHCMAVLRVSGRETIMAPTQISNCINPSLNIDGIPLSNSHTESIY